LLVICSKSWSQDTFDCVIQAILIKYKEFEKVDFVVGADRASLRFSWRKHFFYLQLECCIETMWIEPCDLVSKQKLTTLAGYMQSCR
jgi:hypothetical protein